MYWYFHLSSISEYNFQQRKCIINFHTMRFDNNLCSYFLYLLPRTSYCISKKKICCTHYLSTSQLRPKTLLYLSSISSEGTTSWRKMSRPLCWWLFSTAVLVPVLILILIFSCCMASGGICGCCKHAGERYGVSHLWSCCTSIIYQPEYSNHMWCVAAVVS